ncbi:unnamed protein product [Gongylonema pulchrum]|uniref:V-SNARE domain-containing protein n=1 Tax=Gongylonema pulchrum TaxID=637853 RepID=A0A183DHW1_9BILA|nr:unnamed protein product [Gongylonema pulchrum]
MDEIEQQMIKRKKIETEAGDAFTVRAANLRELEADLDGSMKQVASPIIHKYEQELRQIRKKKLCATTMAEMNLTTKRVLFDLIGWAVSFLRNTLYILARIRDIVVYYAPS